MFGTLLRVAFASAFAALSVVGAAHGQPAYGDRARDHAAILKMVGTFDVTFDMRENAAIVPGYAPLPPKTSRGYEVVRAIENTPDRIVLQHLLVASLKNGGTMVIKHWRQDWAWQPHTVLVYAGRGRWTTRPVPAEQRRGAWSQTVWQTDDAPRYGGVGRWRYDDGAIRWTSEETARPLARRDAMRRPPYDHYIGTNRHVLTADGWLHEQENAKVGLRDGRPATFVREQVANTYTVADGNKAAAADAYWARTGDYWRKVRGLWRDVIRAGNGVTVAEEPETGTVTAETLMTLADRIDAGDIPSDTAMREAATTIQQSTGR